MRTRRTQAKHTASQYAQAILDTDSMVNEQVSRIKERVEEKEGIPPVQQRLIYGGKQMYVSSSSPLLSFLLAFHTQT